MGKTISKTGCFEHSSDQSESLSSGIHSLREGEYEFLHEFKERINEIMDLQKKTHEIIDNNENNPQIQLVLISGIAPT